MANILTNFLSLLASPLRPALGQGVEIAKKIKQAQAKPGEEVTFNQEGLNNLGILGDVLKSQQVGTGANPFLTDKEKQNQLITTAKGLAGAGMYAVPFGKGANVATKFIIPGAATGSLSGLSEPTVTPGGVALSTAGGAAGAWLLGGAGALANKTKSGLAAVGEKLIDKSVANFIKTSPAVFQKAAEAGINVNKSFQKYFKPTDKIDDLLGKIGEVDSKGVSTTGKIGSLISESEKVINKTLKNYGDDIIATVDDLVKPLEKQLEKLKKTPGNTAKTESLTNFIEETKALYKDGLNAKNLLEVKRIFDQKFGESVVDDTTGAVIRDAQKSIANTARGILKDTFKSIKNALDNESELYTLRPILERSRAAAETTFLKQPGGLGLIDVLLGIGGAAAGNPLVGAGLIAGKKALQSPTALNIAGKTAQAAGNAPIPTSNLLNQILGLTASRAGAEALPSVVAPEQQQAGKDQAQNEPTKQVAPPNLDPEKQRVLDIINQDREQSLQRKQTLTGYSPEQLGQALSAAMMAGDTKSASVLKSLYDLESSASQATGKQLPAGELGKLAEMKSAIGLIPELQSSYEESKDVFGPVKGNLRGRNPYDTQAKKADATIFLVKQIIGKGLEGGVLRKEDEYKYEKILPKVTDTQETVQNKINLLQQVLSDKYNTTIQLFQQGGYDPYGGTSGNADILSALQAAGLQL